MKLPQMCYKLEFMFKYIQMGRKSVFSHWTKLINVICKLVFAEVQLRFIFTNFSLWESSNFIIVVHNVQK